MNEEHEKVINSLPVLNNGVRAYPGLLVNDPDGNLCKILEVSIAGVVTVKYMEAVVIGGVQCPQGMVQCGRPATRYSACK